MDEPTIPTMSSNQPRSLVGSSNPTDNDTNEDLVMCSSSISRQRSKVWTHFTKKLVNNVWKSECHYCHAFLSGNPKHGTKYLHDHLTRCPTLVVEGMDEVLRNLAKNKAAIKVAFNQNDCRKALAGMIVMHEYPLSIVDHSGFRNFMNILQPVFKCPSRNTIKSDIMKIYALERRNLIDVLEACDSRIAITTDMWTSNSQRRGYMAITAHYIDASWSLQNQIIRFCYVPCPHTKEVLCDVLLTCLLDCNIDNKISTVTLDNCSTNDAMMKLVREKMQAYDDGLINLVRNKIPSCSMILFGRFLHMRCCMHILNLIVKEGLTVITSGIENIRDSVFYWTAMPKRQEKFEETAKQLKISFSKKLCLDCETRWNSTFLMLQTAIMYKDVFFRLSIHEVHYTMFPSEDDWKFCFELIAKDILAIPILTVASESAFSTSGRVIDAHRSRLRPKTIKALMCSQS